MKKIGAKLLKFSISICLSAVILLLPIVLLLNNLEPQYLISILKILFALIFGFGVVSIVLMKMGYLSSINENNRIDSPIKERFKRFGTLIMKISAFLCGLFFVLIFIFATISFDNEKLFEILVKYSFILSVIFGTISFMCLLFCSPKPINNCEKYCISYKDFSDFYFNFSNLLKNKKYKMRGCTTTMLGNEIFIYRKKRLSIDYYFIIKATENQNEIFFGEVHDFCYKILKKDLPFNFGTITVNNIVCFENKNCSYDNESYINSTSYRRWTNLYIGILFSENEIRLCNGYDVYRTNTINRMKRRLKDLLNLSDN